MWKVESTTGAVITDEAYRTLFGDGNGLATGRCVDTFNASSRGEGGRGCIISDIAAGFAFAEGFDNATGSGSGFAYSFGDG